MTVRRQKVARRSARAKIQAGTLIFGMIAGAGMTIAYFVGKGQGELDNYRHAPLHTSVPSQTTNNGITNQMAHNPMQVGENMIADIAQDASKSVVNIDTARIVRFARQPMGLDPLEMFGLPMQGALPQEIVQQRGVGSGIIIRADGYILTNNHVVGNADKIKVTLEDKRTFEGKVVGRDGLTDLALIKVEAKDLPVAKIGVSQIARPGDWAIAIGSPLGLDHTVTLGIISALGRSLDESAGSNKKLLQTDAAINPGNSGGPLLNIKGEVIGINQAINANGQNIGFAIPSEVFQDVAHQLLEYGHIKRPYIGLYMAALNEDLATQLGLKPDTQGVVVARIYSESPAHKAGLAVGDLIVAVDNKPVKEPKDVKECVQAKKVGEKLAFKILRNGASHDFEIRVGDMPLPQDQALSR